MSKIGKMAPGFLRDEAGLVAAEFVGVFFAFIIIAFFAIEVTLAFFWWKTAEKATQLGARVAVVSTPIATGVPTVNTKTANGIFGHACSETNTCTDPGTFTCVGGGAGCNVAEFNRMVGRMRDVLGLIKDENVTVRYQYIQLGFAGGPYVPLVTVTLSGINFAGYLPILGTFVGGGTTVQLPPISARVTGEDLDTNAP